MLLYIGYGISSVYAVYMLQGYITPALSTEQAAQTAPLLQFAGMPGALIAMALSGRFSDKLQRRKPFVIAASLIMAAGFLIPFISPSLPGMFGQAIVTGFGFGMFLVVDQALFIEVLPDREAAGRDLGLSTLGQNLGQAVGPVTAGVVVAIFGGAYGPVWPVAFVLVAIRPWRSCRSSESADPLCHTRSRKVHYRDQFSRRHPLSLPRPQPVHRRPRRGPAGTHDHRGQGRPHVPAACGPGRHRRAWGVRSPSTRNRELVRLLSGLELGSMFSASKIAWFLERYGADPSVRVGTVDTWLLDRLTGGAVYATEAGNASRTLLLDIEAHTWSPALGELFGVDLGRLAQVRPSVGPWGVTAGVPGVPDGTPILAVLGDSHAALYGHWALSPEHSGVGKATYGTGSSVMVPTTRAAARTPGVATTLAWQAPESLWALEGNILYSGAGMDWLARTLGVAPGAGFSALAATAGSSGGAVFVPALNGLGAPWWAASAVGTLTGLSSATTRAEIARAGIEAVAHQICDVVDAMDPDRSQPALHAGGGATSSEPLVQVQADLLGRTLLVSSITDISALGAAALAFTVAGLDFTPSEELAPRVVRPSESFTSEQRTESRAAWRDALARAGVREAIKN